MAKNAAPDGYTISQLTVNALRQPHMQKVDWDPLKDFTWIIGVSGYTFGMVVKNDSPMKSFEDVVKYAKANPGKFSYSSTGIGTSPHLSGELFALMTGAKVVHVPYRGSTPAVTDLLGGQVQFMFAPASSVLPHVKAGKLKALAVTSAKRSAVAPDLPTMEEAGLKGFETSVWVGLVAPAGTPPEVAARLRAAAHAAIDSPEVQATYKMQGIDPVKTSQDEFARYMRSEAARWGRLIKTAGIKPE